MSTVTVTKEDALAAWRSASVRVLAKPVVLAVPAAPPGSGQPELAETTPTGAEGGAQQPAAGAAVSAAAQTNWWVRLVIAVAAIIAVVVGWVITVHYTHDPAIKFGSAVPKPVDGLTIFAVFFVAAAAVERFLEPISGLLPDKADLKKEAEDQKAKAGTAYSQGQNDQAKDELQKAAQKQANAKDWVFGETIGFWALATILGIIASAVLKLYLPHVVGIASGGRAIQILATGLVIGGGTKPLHDLIGYMTAAKDSKEEKKNGNGGP